MRDDGTDPERADCRRKVEEKIEQVFVANGLLCWMYLIRQDLEEALHVMQTFRERCKKKHRS